jgi:hypothetical protein
MPYYNYNCGICGMFEQRAGYDDKFVACSCGLDAERAPFSGVPGIIGFVGDGAETGWDGDRAIGFLRSKVREDKEGRKTVNVNA